ncbi:MAG: TRAP transporter substrate-binding protein DctP, partial [Myxococcales bacterium]
MRRTLVSLLFGLSLVVSASPALAQKVTVKLGTLAPDGSAWHNLLKDMAEQWKKASNGAVELKIYAGGKAGNEGDMVKKLQIGQLHAAAISVIGLHDIESGPQAASTPGMIANDKEWDCVFDKLTPTYEKKLDDKGFVVLSWGDTGWARIFTRRDDARTPAALKGMKIFAWAGDPHAARAWETVGFQPVVISSTDILPSLSTGMIEGFATTPIMAMTARWFEQAKNMPDVNWGKLPGATIITKSTWEKIPAEHRPKLMEIARATGAKINTEVAKMSQDAVESMKKNGLKVIALNDAEKAEWQKAAEKSWPVIRGGVVTAEDFDQVKKVRD